MELHCRNHIKYSNLELKYALWTTAIGAHLVGRCILYSYRFLVPLIWWIPMENRWHMRQPAWPKSSLSRHLLNPKVPSTSKALKLYTTSSSASTTDCFAPVFKRKLNRCMMNCDDRLRRSNKTSTNRHWMSSVKNSRIHAKWLCTYMFKQ